MFGLFLDDVFMDFWSNKAGDIFIDLTCSSLGYDKNQVDLVFYPGMSSPPSHHELDGKKLRIMNEVVTIDEEPVLDENGDPVFSDDGQPLMHNVSSISYHLQQTIDPVPYLTKGIFNQVC